MSRLEDLVGPTGEALTASKGIARGVREVVTPGQVRIHHPARFARDLDLVRRGVMDPKSLMWAHRRQHNPVQIEVRGPDGRLKAYRVTHNLRTNDGIDWQARQMGGGPSSATLAAAGFRQTNTASITITAPTGSAAGQIADTNTNISASTSALNQFIGTVLVMGNALCHIVGNAASATNSAKWYFDNWFDPSNPGATIAAPSAGAYLISPGSPAFYVGLTTDATAPAATDHLLASEITTNGLVRAFAATATNWSHTAGTNTYQIQVTFTATGSFTAVQKCGMFTGFSFPNDASADLTNVGKGGGVMVFENTFSSVNLAANDTLKVTWTVTY